MSAPFVNAKVTVTLGDQSLTFELQGDELSRTGGKPYLCNASRSWVADEVERALLQLTKEVQRAPDVG